MSSLQENFTSPYLLIAISARFCLKRTRETVVSQPGHLLLEGGCRTIAALL